MPIWIPITLVCAFLQNLRSTLQKQLKGALGTRGATFVRFGFGMPFALVYLGIYHFGFAAPLPVPNNSFFAWTALGAVTQISATFLLVHMFSFRNFAVGTAYSRTEPAQAALFALIFLGDRIWFGAVAAICVSIAGVMLISVARTNFSPFTLITSVFTKTAGTGLLSGTLFGVSAVAYRSASLALAPTLPSPDYIMQASYALAIVTMAQTAGMGVYMFFRDRGEFGRILAVWKPSLATGFVSATSSFGWFMAMTLQQASIVKALAQVEMLFAFASAVLVFKEKINRLEIIGCGLIVGGILLLLA
jgi:drug/metabolite transporter (DMT)-like permease